MESEEFIKFQIVGASDVEDRNDVLNVLELIPLDGISA